MQRCTVGEVKGVNIVKAFENKWYLVTSGDEDEPIQSVPMHL